MLQQKQVTKNNNIPFTQKLSFLLLFSAPERAADSLTHLRKTTFFRLLPLTILILFVTACQEGGAIPPAFCDAYNNSLYTLRLAGGAFLILGLAFLGFKKQISTILPSQGAQTGAVAGSIAIGILLLALTTDIGSQILITFGLPDINTQC